MLMWIHIILMEAAESYHANSMALGVEGLQDPQEDLKDDLRRTPGGPRRTPHPSTWLTTQTCLS